MQPRSADLCFFLLHMCPSVLLMIVTLDGKQEWCGHWTQPGRETHHRLKFSIQQYIGCINGGRAPETKVIVLIYPVLVILTWSIASIFRHFFTCFQRRGLGGSKKKFVFKYLKGYHVRGSLGFYFLLWLLGIHQKQGSSTSVLVQKSNRSEYMSKGPLSGYDLWTLYLIELKYVHL